MSSIRWHGLPPRTWMNEHGNRARKKDLNMKKELPCISEVQARLGAPLSHVFFDTLVDEEKKELGLIPKLKGPEYTSLWVAPGDSNCNRIKLSAAEHTRYQQALTHQNILNIGEIIENTLNHENEQKRVEAKNEAIKETIEFLTIRKELKARRLRDKSTSYEDILENPEYSDEPRPSDLPIVERFSMAVFHTEENENNNRNESEHSQATQTSLIDLEALNAFKDELETQMQQALTENEQYVMKRMRFLLLWESEKKCEAYKWKMIEEHKKWLCLYNKAKTLFQRDLEKIKSDLEAKHSANILEVHEQKMIELKTLKDVMQKQFNSIVEKHRDEMDQKEKMIKDLTDSIELKERAIQNCELKVSDIMEEFQNFIQFILKEAPGQADFLLHFESALEETLVVPQTAPAHDMEQEGSNDMMANEVGQFLEECDFPLNTVGSTAMEVTKQENESGVAFDEICSEISNEKVLMDKKSTSIQKMSTSEQQTGERFADSRLNVVLGILKRHPSLQKLFITTNIAKK